MFNSLLLSTLLRLLTSHIRALVLFGWEWIQILLWIKCNDVGDSLERKFFRIQVLVVIILTSTRNEGHV